jgi:hypothetical protein
MAYQRADPRPFTPQGFLAMEVQHRELLAWEVVRHQHPLHEDFIILSINPLPSNALLFGPLQEVIFEFLENT